MINMQYVGRSYKWETAINGSAGRPSKKKKGKKAARHMSNITPDIRQSRHQGLPSVTSMHTAVTQSNTRVIFFLHFHPPGKGFGRPLALGSRVI